MYNYDKGNKNVYLLQVEAYTNKYGELQEKESTKVGVYSTRNMAIQQGLKWLNERLKYLKESSLLEEPLEEILGGNTIYYDFKVIETNPEYADNYEFPENFYECENDIPTHIVYKYDFNGELLLKTFEYRDYKHNQSYERAETKKWLYSYEEEDV